MFTGFKDGGDPLSGAFERERRKEERAQKLAERGEVLEALPRKGKQ